MTATTQPTFVCRRFNPPYLLTTSRCPALQSFVPLLLTLHLTSNSNFILPPFHKQWQRTSLVHDLCCLHPRTMRSYQTYLSSVLNIKSVGQTSELIVTVWARSVFFKLNKKLQLKLSMSLTPVTFLNCTLGIEI